MFKAKVLNDLKRLFLNVRKTFASKESVILKATHLLAFISNIFDSITCADQY